MTTSHSSQTRLRPFQPADLEPVVGLWNHCLHKDPISTERFWRLYLLDPNFSAEGALIAESEGKPVGYLQALYTKTPPGLIVPKPDTGWITAFFVAPEFRRQGVGAELMRRGLQVLKDQGCSRATCNGYGPYYSFPGVNLDYGEAGAFMRALGFKSHAEAVAMSKDLEGVRTPEDVAERRKSLADDGTVVRWFEPADTLPLLQFSEECFPSWRSGLIDGLQHDNRDIMVVVRRGLVLGYTQWQNTQTDPPFGVPGRFGPFGVHPEMRGQGLGAVIFYALIEEVQKRGCRELWFGWAGGRNLSFYERAGCRVMRRFQLFAKQW